MAKIEITDVTKFFPGGVKALDHVSLTIDDGEFMVLVGPTGCGKTTLMRIVSGLEDVTTGAITIDGRDVTDVSPRARDIAMVFQNYALYPHMTVRKNLAYGLKVRRVPKADIERRVTTVARMLGLIELLDRRPAALSGGQRQRVAMGRAIVREPKAFLLDEPLSNLDAKLRIAMRAELARLHDRLNTTTIYVTHDQVEAMTLGHRVAVLRNGKIEQVDAPTVLYDRPASLFVAAFIGSPSMNLFYAEVTRDEVKFAGMSVPLPQASKPVRNGQMIVGIRPHAFEDARLSREVLPTIDIVPTVVEALGDETHVIFPIDQPAVDVDATRAVFEGEEARLLVDDGRALLTARVDWRSTMRAGEPGKLAVDWSLIYFFDPESGLAIPRLTGTSEVRDGEREVTHI